MKFKNTLSFALFAAVLGGLVYGIVNAQDLHDWWRLRNYDPPARIAKIADDTTMSSQTKRLFYINHPQLDDKQTFRGNCPVTEQSIVLGCYVNTDGIFLLDVKDERLSGVVEVTAAHEVLHAAYDRLGDSERERVDKLAKEFFEGLENQRIKQTVENYRQRDASVVPNELHSILGTEVRELPPELEEYYSQYFQDRQKIVGYSEQYEQTFIQLRQQVSQYDEQLKNLKSQIDSVQSEIKRLSSELRSDREELDRLLASGDKESYNDRVPGYNQKVGSYNQLINQAKQLISSYNDLVEKRNALAETEEELQSKLDSSQLTPEERQ